MFQSVNANVLGPTTAKVVSGDKKRGGGSLPADSLFGAFVSPQLK
jgi:hypothetical protein